MSKDGRIDLSRLIRQEELPFFVVPGLVNCTAQDPCLDTRTLWKGNMTYIVQGSNATCTFWYLQKFTLDCAGSYQVYLAKQSGGAVAVCEQVESPLMVDAWMEQGSTVAGAVTEYVIKMGKPYQGKARVTIHRCIGIQSAAVTGYDFSEFVQVVVPVEEGLLRLGNVRNPNVSCMQGRDVYLRVHLLDAP